MVKKILLISHQLDYSGAPFALLDLGRALKSFGCEVHLASLKNGPLKNEFLKHGITFVDHLDNAYDFCLANTVICTGIMPSLKGKIPILAAWIHESPSSYKYHPHLSYNNIPDNCLDYIFGVARFQVKALRKFSGGATVFRFDNTIDLNNLFGISKLIISNSTKEKHRPEKELQVCMVGWEEKRKGFYKLNEILEFKPPSIPVKFTLIGHGTEIIANNISSHSPDNVTCVSIGKLRREDVISHLGRSDLMLNLSEDEVKPISVLEAISLGVPVVARNIPAFAELAQEFNTVQCSDNPLRDIWNMAESNPNSIGDRTPGVINTLGRYSWDSFLSRTEFLLDLLH